jgi:sec-independent protein translocase protein TatC
MPILAHLSELRRRLIISLVAIAVATCVAFAFSGQILGWLLMPLGTMHLKAFDIMDGFMVRWRVSLYAGIVVTFPLWAYELYRYIRPALDKRAQRAVWPILLFACLLFVAGMLFAFYLLFSIVKELMLLFPPQVDFMPAADQYLSFAVFFMLACGVVFQLPTVITILVRLGLVRAQTLSKQRRIAYFVLFAFAEVITPVADPIVAPLTVMLPLILLYEASIIVAYRIEKSRARRLKREQAEAPAPQAQLLVPSEKQ